jgi:hypothetical protein
MRGGLWDRIRPCEADGVEALGAGSVGEFALEGSNGRWRQKSRLA